MDVSYEKPAIGFRTNRRLLHDGQPADKLRGDEAAAQREAAALDEAASKD